MATMKRSAWESAQQLGRRVFFEAATETIRQCPENYCLLVRVGNQWRMEIDAASPINGHSMGIVLNQHGWGNEMDGDVLADAIEEAFWGSQPIGGVQ